MANIIHTNIIRKMTMETATNTSMDSIFILIIDKSVIGVLLKNKNELLAI